MLQKPKLDLGKLVPSGNLTLNLTLRPHFSSLFSLPILQRILTNPNSRAIIVCPSRELCAQTYQFLKILTSRCSDFISLYELGNETESDDVIGASIVMGTPGRLVKAIKGNRLVMKDVAVLVLDEGTGDKNLRNPRTKTGWAVVMNTKKG